MLVDGQPHAESSVLSAPSVLDHRHRCVSVWLGVTLHPRQIAGVWGPEHLSNLEMLVDRNALQHFLAQLTGQAVLVHSDNATVVAYINHQGGTRSFNSTGAYSRGLLCRRSPSQ